MVIKQNTPVSIASWKKRKLYRIPDLIDILDVKHEDLIFFTENL